MTRCVLVALLCCASARADISAPPEDEAPDEAPPCRPPREHIAAVRRYCAHADRSERRDCRFVEDALEHCYGTVDETGRSARVLAQEPACDYDVFELDFHRIKGGWQVDRLQRVTYHDR
jgi:hypothetical protein